MKYVSMFDKIDLHLIRVLHTVLFRRSTGLASGFWDMFLFVFTLVIAGSIGGFAPFLRSQRKRH